LRAERALDCALRRWDCCGSLPFGRHIK
jgi:hypothetical protein